MTDTTIVPGARFGQFQILRMLGRGGMSNVYAARDLNLKRDIAMKVLLDHLAKDADYVRRFEREAHATAKLNHPNIVQVYDVGHVGSQYYITQELVDGQNLRERLSDCGRIGPDEAFEVLISVATALQHAASFGITHRDIKPENIMRASDGSIKVADFGLVSMANEVDQSGANLTVAGLTLGTPRYMSPEQIQGKRVDVRSDLYSLGVSMYHLLAGRPPFEADDPLALAVMHLNETPPPLDRVRDPSNRDKGDDKLPAWMVATVAKLMDKQADRRFQSAGELLAGLQSRATVSSDEGVVVGGAAGMRIRLQRATDEAKRGRFRRSFGKVAVFAAPVLAAVVAGAVTFASSSADVTDVLNPAIVEEFDSVQEQYLQAQSRGDVAGWKAVSNYFPPSDSVENKTYASKAGIHLVRLYIVQDRLRDAFSLIRSMEADPSIKDVYRVALLAEKCVLAEAQGDQAMLSTARNALHNTFSSLHNKQPEKARMLLEAIPEKEANTLGAILNEPSN